LLVLWVEVAGEPPKLIEGLVVVIAVLEVGAAECVVAKEKVEGEDSGGSDVFELEDEGVNENEGVGISVSLVGVAEEDVVAEDLEENEGEMGVETLNPVELFEAVEVLEEEVEVLEEEEEVEAVKGG